MFVLWEANAIARYLARKDATGTLWPSDSREAAEIDRLMDCQLSTVREHIHPFLRARLTRDKFAHHAQRLADAFDPLEAPLAGRPYLAGESFPVTDIPLSINA